MVTKIGINGFGRIGRQILRVIMEQYRNDLEVVSINDGGNIETNAHLFKYDSTYGTYNGTVTHNENILDIDGHKIIKTSDRNPENLDWSKYGIDIVVESTGNLTDRESASTHLNNGAKTVLVTAPASNADLTMVLGVNENEYDPKNHKILSNASCTTNCAAPLVKVLHDNFGINQGLMTTVHSYTNDQKVLDGNHKDLRRARTAAGNIIPTSTGAAKTCAVVMPELQGKVHGVALRVPTQTVSVVDFVATLDKKVTSEDINQAYKNAAETSMEGIIQYCDEPLVSSDFRGSPYSCIFDSLSTMVLGNSMVKILGWYDNEWGYSCRTAEMLKFIANK